MHEYTPQEKERLLLKTAVARDDGSVLLMPEQIRLCHCDEPNDAKLVAKAERLRDRGDFIDNNSFHFQSLCQLPPLRQRGRVGEGALRNQTPPS